MMDGDMVPFPSSEPEIQAMVRDAKSEGESAVDTPDVVPDMER